MMKTKIVLCCDHCEKVLDDKEMVYGYLDTSTLNISSNNEIYICEDCFNKIVENMSIDIIKDAIRDHEFYIGLNVSKSIKQYHYKLKSGHEINFGELFSMCKTSFFSFKDHTYFVYKTIKNELLPFYISISNKEDDIKRIKELLTESFKNSIYHYPLNIARNYISSDRKKLECISSAACRASDIIRAYEDPNNIYITNNSI